MRKFLLPLFYLTAAFAIESGMADHGGAEYRAFKSRSGKEIRARLLSVDGPTAHLRTSAGKNVPIPLQALSVDDQAYVQSWNPNERRDAWLSEFALSDFLGANGFSSVRLTLKDNGLFTKATFNGQSHEFPINTGQFLSVIDRKLAVAAGAEITDVVFADYNLADGSKESVNASVFKTLELGQAKLSDWEMGSCDFERVGLQLPGTIGTDFFEVTDAMIDWRKKTAFLKTKNGAKGTGSEQVGNLREFESVRGSKLLGELVSFDNGVVKLNVNGGEQKSLPITALSEADREYIDLWSSDPRRGGFTDVTLDEILAKTGYVSAPYGYGNSTVAAFEMKIGEEKVRFLLNPTLPISYLDQKAAMRIKLAAKPMNEFLIVGSKKVQLHAAKVENLSIGGAVQPPISFRITDLRAAGQMGAIPIKTCMIFRFPEMKQRMTEVIPVDGVLGLDFVMKLGTLIDYQSQKMFVKTR